MSYEKVENPEIKDIIEHCIRPRKEDRLDQHEISLNNKMREIFFHICYQFYGFTSQSL